MWDLAVVGAGPAGCAAALALLRQRPEARVLLLDKADFPRDKRCGDGIAPHAVAELERLGAADAVADAPAVRWLDLRSPHGVTSWGQPAHPLRVVPRRVFDARLVAAATARGAVLHRARVRRLRDRGDRVEVEDEVARVVVGADGANSTVRRLLGVAPNPPDALAVAVRGYAPAAVPGGDDTLVIAMVFDGWPAYWWSFPVAAAYGCGGANVGYGLVRRSLTGGRGDLHHRLAALVPDAPADPATLRVHHLPLTLRRPAPAQGRVLLAGDAASLINPLTGEGIFYALLSGRLAGLAATAADPARRYRALLRRALGAHLRSTTLAGRLTHASPRLASTLIGASSQSQRLYDGLVDLGLGCGRLTPRLVAGVALAAARGAGRPA